MAKEIEAKIKVDDPVKIATLVCGFGGKSKYIRFETNIFYDTPKAKLDSKGEVLRLRQERYLDGKDSVSMTFKGRRKMGKMKIREEHEFNVSDFDQARLLLTSLGYRESFRFEKRRTSFLLDGCLVEIDTLPYLGHFCEVEGKDEVAIRKILKLLGLQDAKLIVDGYGSLLRKDAIKNKRNKKMAEFKTKEIV